MFDVVPVSGLVPKSSELPANEMVAGACRAEWAAPTTKKPVYPEEMQSCMEIILEYVFEITDMYNTEEMYDKYSIHTLTLFMQSIVE